MFSVSHDDCSIYRFLAQSIDLSEPASSADCVLYVALRLIEKPRTVLQDIRRSGSAAGVAVLFTPPRLVSSWMTASIGMYTGEHS